MTVRLEFLTNEAGEEEGLGHAGIETYKDAPYASLGRECGQNSVDAKLHFPVEIHFDLIRINKDQYPAHAEQLAAVRACHEKARNKREEKEIDFFKRAEEVLKADTITILKVADYNTKGLIGPSRPGTPFHTLVKGSGVSSKESQASGGSFGIGKNAAYAVSELQTVFYSTVYVETETRAERFLAQGKTILISHSGPEGQERRATGYWGRPNFHPVSSKYEVPEWLRRDRIGTTVSVVGFRESENWQYRIAASLLQNFFCAIHRREMRFLIDNARICIDDKTIAGFFRDEAIISAARDSDQYEEFQFAQALFECLVSSEAVQKTLDIEGYRFSLRMLLRDDLPKRVCIVRNGMCITDNLAHFGDKFAAFPLYKPFVALVEPSDTEGSAFIKRLENPRHDELSAERLSDRRKRSDAARVMKKLAREIRDAIKEQALPKPDAEVEIDELTEFFEDDQRSRRPAGPGGEDNLDTFSYCPAAPRRLQRAAANAKGELNTEAGGRGRATGTGTMQAKTKGGHGTAGSGRARAGSPVGISDFRNVLSTGSPWHRRLYFTPHETGKVTLELRAPGLEFPEALTIVKAERGTPDNGRLIIDLKADERVSLGISLVEDYSGPVELIGSREES